MRSARNLLGLLMDYKKSNNLIKIKLNNQEEVVGRIMEVKGDCIGLVNEKNPGYGYVVPLGAISCIVVKS